MIGNSYSTDVSIGRYDAFSGAVMLGLGNGEFKVKNGNESGFLADKDARSLVGLDVGEKRVFVVGNNDDRAQVFGGKNID